MLRLPPEAASTKGPKLGFDQCLPVLLGQVAEGDLMRELDQIEPALQVC